MYVVPWLAALLPMTPEEFMLLNGLLKPPFAAALLADRYAAPAAAFVALSLGATATYLTLVAHDRQVLGCFVRDIGLTALAVAVAIRSASDSGH